jgi:hypothetical protein
LYENGGLHPLIIVAPRYDLIRNQYTLFPFYDITIRLACAWRIITSHLKTGAWGNLRQIAICPTLFLPMKDLIVLLIHLLTTLAKLMGPGGVKAVVADSLLLKQQLLEVNRARQRAPNLSALDRFLLGFWSLFLSPHHILRAAVVIKPSTLLRFHEALKKRKYRLLFSPCRKGKPGPKGPSPEIIQVIVEMKRRNPRFGCPRIAQQISKAFGIEIDKDVVRQVLAKHYRPDNSGGPSWLTFIGHMKDSLWSVDLFRC